MRINGDGMVGINIHNPNHTLDVNGSVFSNNGFYTPTYTNSDNYYFGTIYI